MSQVTFRPRSSQTACLKAVSVVAVVRTGRRDPKVRCGCREAQAENRPALADSSYNGSDHSCLMTLEGTFKDSHWNYAIPLFGTFCGFPLGLEYRAGTSLALAFEALPLAHPLLNWR